MPSRLSSFTYRGKYHYFVTFCTNERQRLFTSSERIECVRSQMLRTCTEKDFAIPAGVFMPDHVHFIVQGLSDAANFTRCMTRMRQMTACSFRQEFHERLWQRGYYDRILRNADEAPLKIAYMSANPVRAGLVSIPADYPYLWTPHKTFGL